PLSQSHSRLLPFAVAPGWSGRNPGRLVGGTWGKCRSRLAVGPLIASDQKEEVHAYEVGGTITIKRLVLRGKYLLWDYSAGRAIAEGPFQVKLDYRGRPDKRDWEKAFDKAMESVAASTPFLSRKSRR